MQLLCPACRTPLPGASPNRAMVLTCDRCSAEVDVSRAGTAAGRPRFVPEIDRTGDTVGGFVLEARIGAGGMGTVYRARRPGDASPAALKFLSPALASEPDVVARFHREVKLLQSLSHPAIVRVIDHGDENGVAWFAMELVDGPDLRARLAKGPLGLEEVGGVFGRLFDALAHAHEKGIIHRDLKPANVLLAADGAKLADFGIARPDPDAASHATKLTETAAVLGTFPYMSPEQRAGAEVDRRSDLFSCGVLLYESLTGKLPQGAFAPPSRVNPAFPPRLDLVVSRLLQPDREARYASATDAAEALREAIRPRASMAPVLGFGAVAAVALALVVPAAVGPGAGSAPRKQSAADVAMNATPASPAATPLLALEYGNARPARNEEANPPVSKGASESPAREQQRLEEEQKRSQKALPSKGKPGPSGDDDDDGGRVAAAPTPFTEPSPSPVPIATAYAARSELNVISALENQAALVQEPEVVGLVTTCEKTPVYDKTSRYAKVLATLPKGHSVDKLRQFTKLAFLWDALVGRGAGLFGMPAEPKTTASEPLPQAVNPQEIQQQQAPVPEELWFFVRYSAKDQKGWILADCAAPTKSAKPSYPLDPTPAKATKKSGSSF